MTRDIKQRLDQAMVKRGLAVTRSQAENWIKLGQVLVNGEPIIKAGWQVGEAADIKLSSTEHYVSRAGLKLASVARALELDFRGRAVLDVGSSTGGFTDYALRHGARLVIAVDVGTEQLHPSLRSNSGVELHEQTNILDVRTLSQEPDIVLVDVSFVSLRQILPHVATLCGRTTDIIAMFKPQFEAGNSTKHRGIIKNDRLRRDLLKDFEAWAKRHFIVVAKADSEVAGSKGNLERFYKLHIP